MTTTAANGSQGFTPSIKHSLIILTIISVIADTMLLPFYPEFFERRFGVTESYWVGIYIANLCLTVMVFFPMWAFIAKRINELHLWIWTQMFSALLGVMCYYETNFVQFWILSQAMLVFKASYLLIYPFVMRLEEKDKHLGMVGLFSVLMHFGAVFGALVGGTIIGTNNPESIFLVMVGSDLLQIGVCIYLINKLNITFCNKLGSKIKATGVENQNLTLVRRITTGMQSRAKSMLEGHGKFLLCLGIVTFLFYFAAFLIRPFFVLYWQSIADWTNSTISGAVFALPGIMALIGLAVNHYKQKSNKAHSPIKVIQNGLLLASAMMLLQAAPSEWLSLVGRLGYGWALFQVTVTLEVLLFERSKPEQYGRDFSYIHLFQNAGILTSSFIVGFLVSGENFQLPFFLAAAFMLITSICFYFMFYRNEVFASNEETKKLHEEKSDEKPGELSPAK